MDYIVYTLLIVIAIFGWGFAYILHMELVEKEKMIDELLEENQKFASKLLRKEVGKCVSKRKRGLKSDGSTSPSA